jgi:hypothetical protein
MILGELNNSIEWSWFRLHTKVEQLNDKLLWTIYENAVRMSPETHTSNDYQLHKLESLKMLRNANHALTESYSTAQRC